MKRKDQTEESWAEILDGINDKDLAVLVIACTLLSPLILTIIVIRAIWRRKP